MNGPFTVSKYRPDCVQDCNGDEVATTESTQGKSYDENAQMICDALNAVYYAAKAAGSIK